jgi:heparin binding hemagglutinin HbhA
MTMNDEIRRTLSDPKPFYALAGAGDLAAEKLKDAPAFLTEVAGSVTALANRIAAEAPERLAAVRSKLGETQINLGNIDLKNLDPKNLDLKNLDPRAARENLREAAGKVDVQALRDKAQTVALMQVGRALEVAGKAVETYDGLADRGKTVVGRYRGQDDSEPATGEHVTVVVEQLDAEAVDEAMRESAPDGESVLIEDAVLDDHLGADDLKSGARKRPGAPGSAATGTGPSSSPSGASPSGASARNTAPKPSAPKPSAPKQTPKSSK